MLDVLQILRVPLAPQWDAGAAVCCVNCVWMLYDYPMLRVSQLPRLLVILNTDDPARHILPTGDTSS